MYSSVRRQSSELEGHVPFKLDVLDCDGNSIAGSAERDSDPPTGRYSFGQVLDLEGSKFTDSSLSFVDGKKIPSLFITQGKFRTKESVATAYCRCACPDIISAYRLFRPNGLTRTEVFLLKAGEVIIDDIMPFAKAVEAQFNLEPGQRLVLKSGMTRHFEIEYEEGLKVEITVKNVEDGEGNGYEESRHFLNHYEFFEMGGNMEYGLVSLTEALSRS